MRHFLLRRVRECHVVDWTPVPPPPLPGRRKRAGQVLTKGRTMHTEVMTGHRLWGQGRMGGGGWGKGEWGVAGGVRERGRGHRAAHTRPKRKSSSRRSSLTHCSCHALFIRKMKLNESGRRERQGDKKPHSLPTK